MRMLEAEVLTTTPAVTMMVVIMRHSSAQHTAVCATLAAVIVWRTVSATADGAVVVRVRIVGGLSGRGNGFEFTIMLK